MKQKGIKKGLKIEGKIMKKEEEMRKAFEEVVPRAVSLLQNILKVSLLIIKIALKFEPI